MVLFAGYEASARQRQKLLGWWTYGIGTPSMMAASIFVTVLALTTQIKPEPWYDPRYALPLFGMILGNTTSGIALGPNALITGAIQEKNSTEARLALGDDIRTATSGIVREAARTGLIPIINAMAAAGIVSLPGMMTGQILAGISPVDVVNYQILIIFLIAGKRGLASCLLSMAVYTD
jgi:putative ABC transport system permease protein